MMAHYQPQQRCLLSGIICLVLSITLVLGCSNVAAAQTISPSLSNPDSALIATGTAEELFRDAYESRYTWDEQFPGYSAEVSVRYEQGLHHGIVRVDPDLSVTSTGIKSEAVRQLVEDQLRMVVTHRRRVPFAQLHGNHRFEEEGKDDKGSVKIREVGDRLDSHYLLQNQKITQVNRLMGPLAVTVDTLGFIKPPEGYLAAHYQTTFRDAKSGEVLEILDISDNYDKIGEYFLLSRRVLRSSEPGQSAAQRAPDTLIRFNDFQPLLESA